MSKPMANVYDHPGNPALARDEDRALLATAEARIPSLRRGELALRLMDEAGAPLAGATVRLRQRSHAFDFGFCCGTRPSRVRERVRDHDPLRLLTHLFNTATVPCYWDERWDYPIERAQGQRRTEAFLERVDWLLARGLRVKGHPLVWMIPKALPAWLRRYDVATQMRFLECHLRGMIQSAEGRVSRWDLCNEMLWEPTLRTLPQRDWPNLEPIEAIIEYLAPAMAWAREEDPAAVLSLNEYGLAGERGGVLVDDVGARDVRSAVTGKEQRDRYLELIDALAAQGLAPDAIGNQSHDGLLPVATLSECWDHLATAGLPLQLTEFWVRPQDLPEDPTRDEATTEALMAAYADAFLTLAFGHPAVEHLTLWGAGSLIDEQECRYSPMGEVFRKRIHERWRTTAELITDAEGRCACPGFFGDYRGELTLANGARHGVDLQHRRGGDGEHGIRLRPGVRNHMH